jgi:hypothetical protein
VLHFLRIELGSRRHDCATHCGDFGVIALRVRFASASTRRAYFLRSSLPPGSGLWAFSGRPLGLFPRDRLLWLTPLSPLRFRRACAQSGNHGVSLSLYHGRSILYCFDSLWRHQGFSLCRSVTHHRPRHGTYDCSDWACNCASDYCSSNSTCCLFGDREIFIRLCVRLFRCHKIDFSMCIVWAS